MRSRKRPPQSRWEYNGSAAYNSRTKRTGAMACSTPTARQRVISRLASQGGSNRGDVLSDIYYLSPDSKHGHTLPKTQSMRLQSCRSFAETAEGGYRHPEVSGSNALVINVRPGYAARPVRRPWQSTGALSGGRSNPTRYPREASLWA